MTSLAYGLDTPYEVQLEYHAATSTRHMTILEPQRTPGQPATRHLLTPGVYMVSLTYNGAAAIALRHEGENLTNSLPVPAGTRGVPRTSAPMKISVQGTTEYMHVEAPSTDESARATISVIPAATFDEMAESAQGVSVLSEISNLKSTKADKSTLDARVPANTSLRLDTSVGTRIFAGDTMIYGDTGWRRVDELFPEFDLSGSGHAAFYRRIGDDVTIHVSGGFLEALPDHQYAFGPALNTIGATPRIAYQASVGTWSTAVQTVSERVMNNLTCAGYNQYLQAPGIQNANHSVIVLARYATRSPWPSTLPGTPY